MSIELHAVDLSEYYNLTVQVRQHSRLGSYAKCSSKQDPSEFTAKDSHITPLTSHEKCLNQNLIYLTFETTTRQSEIFSVCTFIQNKILV